MKKFLLIFAILFIAISAHAQTDTVLVNKPVKFESETITTRSGKSSVKYYAIVDGKYYDSNKTAMKRYDAAIKFGGKPNVAFVSNKKKTNCKVIVL